MNVFFYKAAINLDRDHPLPPPPNDLGFT
ncbi:unnamed protein product [Tetraodon nigroviridis]|uniref:(spotted green pufferfish) hypothetical protein n=1 Tax=Tetraodon nigroviridis TaxID=99883 RepID=Q4RF42_TETNG|nr:unnamed protein product [Tetraodon nigroviridis]